MIFVTVGTQELKFNRLIKYVENSNLKDVFIQSGASLCPDWINHKPYLNQAEFNDYVDKAEFVICHGGITLMELLEKSKKVICVPRERTYKELNNNFQFDLCNYLEENNYILVARNEKEFNEKLKLIKKYKFKKYKKDTIKFYKNLNSIIDDVLN